MNSPFEWPLMGGAAGSGAMSAWPRLGAAGGSLRMRDPAGRKPTAPTRRPSSPAGVACQTTGFAWRAASVHLYLQEPASLLSCARDVSVGAPIDLPALFVSPLGVSMWLGVSGAGAAAANQPGAVVGLTVMCGHPRFAALRRAAGLKRPIRPGEFGAFRSRLSDASQGRLDEAEAQALSSDLIDHLLALFGCQQVTMDSRVHAALRFGDLHEAFCIADIAHALHISSSRLSHLFSEQVGLSFRQYVAAARAIRAWELVAFEPGLSLTEIAHRVEFSDLSHMSRTFRTVFGVPPSQLRQPGLHVIHGRAARRGGRVSPQTG